MASQVGVAESPSWMGSLPRLYESRVCEVVWPGSHDSGAYCEEFDYSKPVSDERLRYYGRYLINNAGQKVRRFISCWAQTQRLSVKEQLDHGVRFLDFRVSKCPTDGQYYIVHSFCGPALVDVLRQVSEFANRNAKEIILIEVVPCSFVDHCELHELFERHLAGLLLRRDKSSAIMSPITLELSHLLEVGRVVLLYKPSNFSSAAVGDCLSFWDGSCVHAPFLETLDPQEKESFQLEQFEHFDSTSHTRVLKHTQLFHFMYSLTPKLKEIVLSLCGRGRPVSLEGCADMLNPRLQRFLDEITQNQKVQGMIVSVDYVDKSQLVQMILDINQRNL